MSYYQECAQEFEAIFNETTPSSGIKGAFSRYFVETWLDKPFKELPDASYDESQIAINKMDYIFSVVLAYKNGIEKGYIPKYALELLDEIISSGYLNILEDILIEEDLAPYMQDLSIIMHHKESNA